MKKIIIVLNMFVLTNLFAQPDANLLLGLTQVTTAEMNAITSPIVGSVLYNTDESTIYIRTASSWIALVPKGFAIVEAKIADYTLTDADSGKIMTFDSATDVTLTIPPGLSTGFNLSVYQLGAGKVILVGVGGVTINNRQDRLRTAGQDAGIGLVCVATNTFYITGDLTKN